MTEPQAPWRNSIVGEGEEAPDQLLANPRNWRIHPQAQQKALAGALDQVGWIQRVIVNRRTGHVIDGHARVAMAISRQEPSVPVVYVDLSLEDEKVALLTLDPLAALAVTDQEMYDQLMAEATINDDDLRAALDSGEAARIAVVPRPSLADRFVVPPFSVLDARQGYWQERKRQWLAMGIQSELGRGENALGLSSESEDYRQNRTAAKASPGGSPRDAAILVDGKTVRGTGTGKGLARTFGQDLMRGEHVVGENGKRLTWVAGDRDPEELDETSAKILRGGRMARPPHGATVTQASDGSRDYRPTNNGDGTQSGTSVFDPVLCELAYRWFSPPHGAVLDPFAGGSVRGIVASALGRRYTGIDLSERQLAANRDQGAAIVPESVPTWIAGDSTDAATLAPGEYDLIFSCPPYGDLEVYSDHERDISAMPYADFLAAYREIIEACVGMLKPDRFACFVVGDIRDKKGYYRNFISHTIEAFQHAGAILYNEAILVTAVGSLSIRVGRQFTVGRKLGKTHQNVLVFLKGDAKKATEACGAIEVTVPGEEIDLVP